jgi:RNA polymerase sigma-70 factor (ECF subfamily)
MVFKLVREDGLKYQEVADILNVSVNTVDAQMVIAVKKLKDVIGEGSPLFSTQGAEKV